MVRFALYYIENLFSQIRVILFCCLKADVYLTGFTIETVRTKNIGSKLHYIGLLTFLCMPAPLLFHSTNACMRKKVQLVEPFYSHHSQPSFKIITKEKLRKFKLKMTTCLMTFSTTKHQFSFRANVGVGI